MEQSVVADGPGSSYCATAGKITGEQYTKSLLLCRHGSPKGFVFESSVGLRPHCV